jgi:hypothetical protein
VLIPRAKEQLAETLALPLRGDHDVHAPGSADLAAAHLQPHGHRRILAHDGGAFPRDPDLRAPGRVVGVPAVLPVPAEAAGLGHVVAEDAAIERVDGLPVFASKLVDHRHSAPHPADATLNDTPGPPRRGSPRHAQDGATGTARLAPRPAYRRGRRRPPAVRRTRRGRDRRRRNGGAIIRPQDPPQDAPSGAPRAAPCGSGRAVQASRRTSPDRGRRRGPSCARPRARRSTKPPRGGWADTGRSRPRSTFCRRPGGRSAVPREAREVTASGRGGARTPCCR